MDYKQRRQILEELLDNWEHFVLPSVGGPVWTAGDGIGLVFASGMADYPSVRELDRCLRVLAGKMPGHYKHLRGWYSAEWRTTDEPVKRRDHRGRMVDDVARVRRRVVPGWVVWRMVDRSLDILLALWGPVALEVPPAFRRKLREFTDQDGTHLTEAA